MIFQCGTFKWNPVAMLQNRSLICICWNVPYKRLMKWWEYEDHIVRENIWKSVSSPYILFKGSMCFSYKFHLISIRCAYHHWRPYAPICIPLVVSLTYIWPYVSVWSYKEQNYGTRHWKVSLGILLLYHWCLAVSQANSLLAAWFVLRGLTSRINAGCGTP